jgi:hypothetical protein
MPAPNRLALEMFPREPAERPLTSLIRSEEQLGLGSFRKRIKKERNRWPRNAFIRTWTY